MDLNSAIVNLIFTPYFYAFMIMFKNKEQQNALSIETIFVNIYMKIPFQNDYKNIKKSNILNFQLSSNIHGNTRRIQSIHHGQSTQELHQILFSP